MLRRKALFGVIVSIALLASSIAWSASRPAGPRRAEAKRKATVVRQNAGSVTIQRLLLIRLDWSLRVSRTLQALEQPEVSRSSGGNGMWTIIDEPDPAGRSEDDKGGTGERPDPIYDGGDPNEEDQEDKEIPLRDAAAVP